MNGVHPMLTMHCTWIMRSTPTSSAPLPLQRRRVTITARLLPLEHADCRAVRRKYTAQVHHSF